MYKKWFQVCCFAAIACRAFGAAHALLIGIGDYGDDSLRLQGPPNDVALLRGYLEKTYPGIDMRVLLDSQATHRRILEELERLAGVQPGDTVFIYFSGHGSQTPDLNGDELTNPFDETWVSYGTRKKSQALDDYDVLDDEIFHYLSNIPTERMIFISDSCHAGSVGHDQHERTLGKDPREHPEGKKYAPSESLPGIRLSAVKDDQLAVEAAIPQAGGRIHGLFTWCLVATLNETGPDGNWHDVLLRTRALMRTFPRGGLLEPQLEGDGSLRLDLSEPGSGEGAAAVRGRTDGVWILEAGLVSGIGNGSRFVRREGGVAVELKVVEAGLFLSKVEKISGADPEIGDLFQLQEVGMNGTKLKMGAAAAIPEDESLSAFLENTVRACFPNQITWEPENERADWVLWLVRSPAYEPSPFKLPSTTMEQPPRIWLADRSGRPVLNRPLLRAEPKKDPLLARIRELLRWFSLLNLSNPHHPPDFRFSPAFYVRGEAAGPEHEQLIINGRAYRAIFPGEENVLPKDSVMLPSLKNLGREPRYLYIVNFAPGGEVSVVFPRRDQRGEVAKLEPGEARRLTRVKLLLGEPGWERFRVISAKKELDPNLFRIRIQEEDQESREVPAAVFDGRAGDWSTALFEYKILPEAEFLR